MAAVSTGTDAAFFYVESRGGVYDQTVFFGLQSILKEAINRPVTHADIDDAKALLAAHGEPFNEAPAGATSSIVSAGNCRSASVPCPKARSCPRTMC